MTGQAWCIGAAIVNGAMWLWYARRDEPQARHYDTASTIWLAAAIIIGSLK